MPAPKRWNVMAGAIVFVAAHQANWNLPAVVGRYIGRPLSVLYRRRKNPHLEAVIEHWRNQMPSGFIDVGARAPKAMLDELKNGRCIGLFIDRRSRDGEEVPFFGLETPTPTIAARLALKTGAALHSRQDRAPGQCAFPYHAPPSNHPCCRGCR